jgi:pimeloyl-ACP methyl ester carboxylesterase
MRRFSQILCAVLAVCWSALPTWPADRAAWNISPNPGLMDDRIRIQLTGLPAHRRITIHAGSQDQRCWWRSSADFLTAPDGSIDLANTAPLSGAYAGIDAMGLFWSMQPDRTARPVPAFFRLAGWFQPVVTILDVTCDGQTLGTARLVRYFAAPGVRAEPFRSDGAVGILYRPGDDRKHRPVILLGGSEGGFPAPEGGMLASRGFVVLALAYFGAPGLPATLQNIPIEYFGKAIHALLRTPSVQGPSVTLIGGSRGAEAALIAGAMYPEVSAVVAVSPSHVRWEGATSKMLPGGAAWTWQGKPLPYVPFHIAPGFAARFAWAYVARNPISMRSMFEDSLHHATGADVQIPVERIRGPVLFGSGRADRLWPSDSMAQLAMDRLHRHSHPFPDQHVSFENTGHWLPSSYVPTAGLKGPMSEQIGGTPAGTAAAQREWWSKVLELLARVPDF